VAFIEGVVLAGELVELSPLKADDHDGLVAAASDGELWTLSYTGVPRPEEMREAIAAYLAQRDNGTMMPFTVRRASTGDVVGVTTFCNVDAANRRVEIGYTWYARSAQKTGINTEAKLLLLGHAFERLDCIAVEFRTHWLNQQSRRAIERLGAKQDGVLRSHSLMRDGALRDTVVFSIIQSEWPAVRSELQRRLAAHR
jgi:RimJ/RimL family protein N-acetyltransferase